MAKKHEIFYKNLSIDAISEINSGEDTVWLVDAELLTDALDAPILEQCPAKTKIVIIVDKYSQVQNYLDQTGREKIIDIFVKTCQKKVLDKKIQLYMNCISQPDKDESKDMSHDLVKKNRSLIRQVTHLQEQLSQIDSDLQVQEEVLEKITQISQLSRQINCLDLNRIAGVCVEQIPQLISARFASIYTFCPETHTLHLLRHNHPFTIDRVISLENKKNSPMAIAVRKKQLLLIKDIPSLDSSDNNTITLNFSRN